MAEFTPMMQQYLETKKDYKDCILFYRLGDFYEMFFEDAEIASKELELTLTGKSCGQEERAPMCGVPYHAVDNYLNRLVNKGYKVAICEQVEDPKLAKGLVKREVTRIVSRGTNLDTQALEASENSFLMCIVYLDNGTGISVVDITTGDFYATEVKDIRGIADEINRYSPKEIICNDAFLMSDFPFDTLKAKNDLSYSAIPAHHFDERESLKALKLHFKVNSVEGLGLNDFKNATVAAGAVLSFLFETQKNSLSNLTNIKPYESGSFMHLDSATRRNLELTETMREKQKRGSLLWVLDKTKTAMGGRLLRSYIEQPLLEPDEMNRRLDLISELCKNPVSRDELREYLQSVYDLERLLGRISYKTANARDLIAFKNSLYILPHVKTLLNDFDSDLACEIRDEIDTLGDIYKTIEEAIVEEPPLTLKEGGIIKDGFSNDIDTLKRAKTEGRQWLLELEAKDRERTGIKNLKIKYNKVFGYYYDVTNSFLNLVPEDYIRKQTLVGSERYTTHELKEMEDKILNAEDKLYGLEYDIFCDIRDSIAAKVDRVYKTSKAIAKLDVFASLSYVAERNHYVRPKLNEKGEIKISDGRHPVVEMLMDGGLFIPNNTLLDNGKNTIAIITGPNMAGKSTYMRQVALIVLMAQIGSFVPAKEANIGIVDRIFTRVGASDDLASGQSTFMVEMNEVANILRNATSNSLLILDEIGRGTSTFDGLSIAWAVIEHISNKKILGAKTLFATHYHELTELEGKMSNVNNYCIAVKENGEDIVFLRKIIKGGADRSYGIQVARLAGIPEIVLNRAKEISEQISDNDITEKIQNIQINIKNTNDKPKVREDEDINQMSLFDTVKDEDIIDDLLSLDLTNMTPLDALNNLSRLQNKLINRW
ncbi:MAG: DNA mismatch repair protein MutS [Lachnospiraceae bacterium]|nr:DNA mismatch repair protein MutS [Lachnospiraceae bacterium]